MAFSTTLSAKICTFRRPLIFGLQTVGGGYQTETLRWYTSKSQASLKSSPTLEHDSVSIDLKNKHYKSLTGNHQHPAINLAFDDAKEAYRSKRTSELARALLVFNLCSIDALVNNQKAVSCSIFIFVFFII